MGAVHDSCGAAVPVQSIDVSMTSSGLDLVPAMPAWCAQMFQLDVLIPQTDSRRLKTRWAYESTYKLAFLCDSGFICVMVGWLVLVVWYGRRCGVPSRKSILYLSIDPSVFAGGATHCV